MAGLLCAYKLDQAGVNYALVEADCICGSITKNTTAKITSQHGLIYDKLIREFGVERAQLCLEANQTALESVHIWPLFSAHLDGNQPAVQQLCGLRVLKTLPGQAERILAPEIPDHRVFCVLGEIGAGLVF